MTRQSELTAILVCASDKLAREFNDAVVRKDLVQLVEHMQDYPSAQQLETRIRQLRPTLVLVDLGTDMAAALTLISVASAMNPTVYVVGVHVSQDAVAIMKTLRAGGTEFLSSPFDPDSTNAALGRIRRLRDAQTSEAPVRGKVFAFTAVKPGQGVTTVASNVAAALTDGGNRRVLLIDFDPLASTLSFSWRVTHGYSVFDAMQNADKLDEALWSALVASRNGVDILLGPEKPDPPPLPAERYARVVEFSRSLYEAIVLDLPSLYGPEARAVLPDCDRIHIVSTPELPSLHLSRKCLAYLEGEGFSKDQFSLVINRMDRLARRPDGGRSQADLQLSDWTDLSRRSGFDSPRAYRRKALAGLVRAGQGPEKAQPGAAGGEGEAAEKESRGRAEALGVALAGIELTHVDVCNS